MKELRFDTATEVWRFAFGYDPTRNAVVLCGSDKQGANEKLFYDQLIDKADKRYDGWLAVLEIAKKEAELKLAAEQKKSGKGKKGRKR